LDHSLGSADTGNLEMKPQNFGYAMPLSAFLLIACLLIVSSCALFAFWLTRGCLFFDCPPKRDFTVFDMNIPKGYLPEDQSIELRPDRGNLTAIEESIGWAKWTNGQAIYMVLKFASEKHAIEWFNLGGRENRFYPDLPSLESHQDILKHPMPNSSNYKTQCGYVLKDFRCILDVRYEEFYIFFSGSVGENQINDQDFIALMDYIDTRISNFLTLNK
jgi:hypothetical protein